MTKRTQDPKAGGRREQLRQQAAAAEAKRRRTRILLVGVGVVVVAVVALGAFLAVQGIRGLSEERAGVTPPNANAEGSGIVVNPDTAQPDAPVLAIYQDYQCPACKSFEDTFGDIVAEMAASGEVKLEYHTMTFLDANLRNDASYRAGVAAACADVAGAYEEYHRVLYANQPQEGLGFNDNQLLAVFPEEAGLSGEALETFKSCYRGEDTGPYVRGTDAAAGEAGVRATPEIRVNGKVLDRSQLASPEQFPALVEQLASS